VAYTSNGRGEIYWEENVGKKSTKQKNEKPQLPVAILPKKPPLSPPTVP
jgi:hypothetical protein